MRQFKVDDKVTVVANEVLLNVCCLPGSFTGKQGVVSGIGCNGYHGSPHSYRVQFEDNCNVFLPELGLELIEEDD